MIVNPQLDLDNAASAFRRNGYVFINDFLRTDVAERLADALASMRDWSFHVIGRSKDYTRQELDKLTPEALGALSPVPPARYTEPGDSLGAYDRYLILEHMRAGDCPAEFSQYFEAVNSAEYIEVMQKISGINSDIWVSADASRYRGQHFLSAHTDTKAGESSPKLAAHVLSLTKGWQAKFGGDLVFCNNWGQIEVRQQPSFNSLALFRVPKRHYVTAVSGDSPFPRTSLYGWLMHRPNER